MKKQFLVLSLTAAALPFSLLADDAVPPKPPGGSNAPAAAPSTPAAPGNPRGGGPAGRFSPEERLKRLTEALNLTQEQQDKIKAIMEKSAPQFRELISKGRENLTDDDKKKIGELLKTQTEDIAAVLTPEQKEKFKELMERRRSGGGPGGAGGGAAAPGGAAK